MTPLRFLSAPSSNYKVNGKTVTELEQTWCNDTYGGVVARPADGSARRISLRRLDWKPITDWRDKQAIKNQLAGPEVEAVEIYPAESRVTDKENFFHLWCLPPYQQIPLGFDEGGREAREDRVQAGKQRAFVGQEIEALNP
jgi:hypothetical protein